MQKKCEQGGRLSEITAKSPWNCEQWFSTIAYRAEENYNRLNPMVCGIEPMKYIKIGLYIEETAQAAQVVPALTKSGRFCAFASSENTFKREMPDEAIN